MAGKAGIKVFLAVFFIALTQIVFGKDVEIDVLSGFSGYTAAGSWVPLNITVESNLPPFDGTLELRIPHGSYRLAGRGEYAQLRSLSIAPGETTRVLMTVPLERNEDAVLRLYRGTEVVAEERITLTARGGGRQNVLVLSRSHGIGIRTGSDRVVLQSHPGALPVSAEGYSCLSAAVLHNAPLNEMSGRQVSALVSWVRAGGTLIVTGGVGPRDRIPAALADIFPIDYYGKGSVESPPLPAAASAVVLPAAEKYPLRRGRLKPDAVFIGEEDAEDAEVSAAAVRNEGCGTVLAITIDPDEVPYRDWKGLTEYWEYLFAAAAGNTAMSVDDQLSTAAAYPVSDPFPDLISQIGASLSDSGRSLRGKAVPFILPMLLPLTAAVLKRKLRGTLLIFILTPLLTAAAVFLFMPEDRPPYYEAACLKTYAGSEYGNLLLKGGIAGRRGGEILLPLNADSIALPNRNERLETVSGTGGRGMLLSLERWELREFFVSETIRVPFETELKLTERGVSGFISCENSISEPVYISGTAAVKDAVFLPEAGGFSFLITLADAGVVSENDFSSSEEQFFDYLAGSGYFDSDGSVDFYIVFMNRSVDTRFSPEGCSTAGIETVIIEFDMNRIKTSGSGR